jgi:intracellular septation protein
MSVKHPSPGLRVALDYAPLVVFFAVNFLAPAAASVRLIASMTTFLPDMDRAAAIIVARVLVATAAFVIATAVAMIASRVKLGSISPMLWISGGLVLVFGGLTLWYHDPTFIQRKPTIVYAIMASVLLFGLVTGRPLLESVLGGAYPGLDAIGWRKLTRNWAMFFGAMAILNEIVWRSTSWDVWVAYKLWGAIPLTAVFAIANVPMLLRHGLSSEEPIAEQVPPEA